MVCGSIGYGGAEEIRHLYSFLRNEGFDTIDHMVNQGMDYSNINDFRDEKDLSARIVLHDLENIKRAEVLVVLANKPSYGAAIDLSLKGRHYLHVAS